MINNKYFGPLILGLVTLSVYAPFYLFDGFLGDFGDPIGQTIPNKFLLIEYIKNGMLPLWNGLNFLGFPFLADIQTGTFYIPDIIIFLLFSPLNAHTVSILVHLVFAAIGIYLLVLNVTKSKIISVTLSLMMVLSGSFLSKIVYLNFLETISFIPWILLVIQQRAAAFTLVFLITLMIFAGHPVALFYSFIIMFVFFFINHRNTWKKVLWGTVIGLSIAGIQIIPFIFLKEESVRDTLSYAEFIQGSLQLKDLLSFFTPIKLNAMNSFDTYIYFGTFAFLCLVGSIFFYKKLRKPHRKIYLTGIMLFVVGILLSLGGNLPLLSKMLYQIPVFNIIRVPARYIVISHFGALLSLAIFFAYLLRKNKKIAVTLMIAIVLNSLLIPGFLLEKHKKSDAQEEYWPEVKNTIEILEHENFSINSPPVYFLSSSFFLFPNRHVLNFMPSVIGYNPMVAKRYHDFFPIAGVGAFENPKYFIDLYEKLELIGLKYYIFPTSSFLKQKKLEEKEYIMDFLQNKGWGEIATIKNDFVIWKNPVYKPFVYFLHGENKINSIDYKPGKIRLAVDVKENDTLIINQAFFPGWFIDTDVDEGEKEAKEFHHITQAYEILKGTKKIAVQYKPKEFYYGMVLSFIGIGILLIQLMTMHHGDIHTKS